MLQRILLALADDPSSEAAASVAVDLARQFKAALTSLAIADTATAAMAAVAPGAWGTYYAYGMVLELEEALRDQARNRVDVFLEKAQGAGIDNLPKIGDGEPWRCLRMESFLHDLLVVGRTAHFKAGSRSEKVPGHTLKRVLDHSECPVLCVSHQPLGSQRVMVGIDGRPEAYRALRAYVQSGIAPSAEVCLVHFDQGESEPAVDWDAVGRYLQAHRRWTRIVHRGGSAPQELSKVAEELGADLVVLGAHGKGRLAEWALGSTTREFLEKSDVAALVFH